MNENNILEIVTEIKEEIDNLKSAKELSEMEYGQLIAFAECLSIIQSACSGYDLSKIKLDFDVDETYLK